MPDTRQIKTGAVISYIAIIFNVVAGLIYTPWMVNVLGKSDYALYVLANTFLTYFVIDFGLWQAIAILLSKYKAEGNEEKANNLLGLSAKLYMIIDSIIFITLIIIYFFIEGIFVKLTPGEIERFKIIYLIAGFFSVAAFPFNSLRGIFISNSFFASAKVFDIVTKAIIIILMILAILLGFGLYSLVIITGGLNLISILARLLYIKKKTTLKINFSFYDKGLTKDLFRTSFWIFMIVVSELMLRNSSPIILGIFSGSGQIAVFAIAMMIDSYSTTIANAINGFFLPKVTELNTNNADKIRINALMVKVGRIQLIIFGLVLVGFATLGKEFINLWMGSDYEGSYYIALLLIGPGIVIFTQEIPNTLLLVSDKIKYRSYLYFTSGIFGIIVSILLVPKIGAIGSGIGIFTASVFFYLIGMNIIYIKRLNLNILGFFKECHLKLLLPILLSLFSGFLIQHFIRADNLLLFFPKAVFLGVVYLIFMWSIGMNNFEKQLIVSVINRILPNRKQ